MENENAIVNKTKDENRKLTDEIVNLKSAVSLVNKDVEILKKEKSQLQHEHKKSIEDFGDKIQKLKKLNSEKMSEEKHFKTREKKAKKKVRAFEAE